MRNINNNINENIIWIVLAVILVFTLSSMGFGLMGWSGYGMIGRYGFGFGGIFMLALWIVLIIFIVWMILRIRGLAK